jgi:hypothetical protein
VTRRLNATPVWKRLTRPYVPRYRWRSPRPGTWVVWGFPGQMQRGQIWSRAEGNGEWYIAGEDGVFYKLHWRRFHMLRHEVRSGEY